MPSTARRAVLSVVALLALLAPAVARAADPPKDVPDTSQDVDLQWGVHIPLRDGVELVAEIYKPAGQKEPLPVIFTLTPYIADSYQDRALYFARHGYVYALVDVRGRGDSGGTFDPFAQEAQDGYDVVEWLARQPWSNGKVAMWGGSYAGYDQWATAKERPPHLATIVPAAAVHPGVDFPFQRGIFYSYDMQWLTFTSGRAKNTLTFGEGSLWSQKYREMYLAHLPFRELDRIVGNPSPVFQRWLSHPTNDAYWQGMVPTPEQYAKIDLPILTITGHYDGDQPGALSYYREHMRYAPQAVRDRHYLIIGPWDHAGTRTPNAQVGGLTFGEASVLDLNDLHKEWYDWTMKGGPRPKFLEKRVAYYVVGPGAETWKRADTLEAIGAERRTLYLGLADGQAGDAFHSGRLADAKPAATAAPDRYVYDPLDLRPGKAEREEPERQATSSRSSRALNLFGNGVVYHSEPFAEATEVSGQVKLSVWMALDVPDTDFQAALYEILPDGGSVLLTWDLPARPLPGLAGEGDAGARARPCATTSPASPGSPAGSRRGAGCAWWSRPPTRPELEKNYNSGGVVADETAKDARTAHVTAPPRRRASERPGDPDRALNALPE